MIIDHGRLRTFANRIVAAGGSTPVGLGAGAGVEIQVGIVQLPQMTVDAFLQQYGQGIQVIGLTHGLHLADMVADQLFVEEGRAKQLERFADHERKIK